MKDTGRKQVLPPEVVVLSFPWALGCVGSIPAAVTTNRNEERGCCGR